MVNCTEIGTEMFDTLLPGQMDYKAGYSKGYAAGFKVQFHKLDFFMSNFPSRHTITFLRYIVVIT